MAKNKKGDYRIPYNPETGDIYDYAQFKEGDALPPYYQDKYAWMDNHEFEDTMQFTSYYRGRSAAGLCLKSLATGVCYSMFMTDFNDVLASCNILKGVVSGTWTFCKRGQNYGIKMVFGD